MSDSIYSIARERTLQSMQRVAEATISKKENVKPGYDRKESERKCCEGHAEQIHSSKKVYRDNLPPEKRAERLEYMRHWREQHPDYYRNYYKAHKRKK